MSDVKRAVLGIKDRFHKFKNGDDTPEVRSDNTCFSGVFDFLGWCAQHGANFSEIYTISDGRLWVYKDFKAENVASGVDNTIST